VLDYWRQVGEGLAISFCRAPGYEFRLDRTGWIAEAGEPFVDFNCALVAPGTEAEAMLEKTIKHFRDRSLPFLVCAVGETEALADQALAFGLARAGDLPLMVLHEPQARSSDDRGPARDSLTLVEAETPNEFRRVAELTERCFGLPAEAVRRVKPFDSPRDPRTCVYLALRGLELVGSVTYSRHENAVGIWSLMTRPDLRRQGIGRQVMTETMSKIWQEGRRPIFLVSTPDGKPLYDLLGFQTVDVGSVWVGRPPE
jgi:predicted N-acetyltransferase YhbS